MLGRRIRLAGAAALTTLLLGACAGGGSGGGGNLATLDGCGDDPVNCNSAQTLQTEGDQTLAYTLPKNIPAWNINSATGNVLATGQVMRAVLMGTHITKPNFEVAVNKNLLVSAKQTKESPQTLVYKIQPDAVWSDGTPITAKDFIYNWKVQDPDQCKNCAMANPAGYEQIASIEGSEGGKTVTVTMEKPYTDWRALWGGDTPMYPAHIAAKHGDIDTPEGRAKAFEWFNGNVPEYSNGPFRIKKFKDNEAVILVPNEKWYGKGPNLDRLIFRIITDSAQVTTALQNNEVQAIAPQPQVDLIEQVKNIPDVDHHVGLGIEWEHFDFNMDNPYLSKEPLRDAMFTAIDRQKIIDKTVGQFKPGLKPLNSHMLMPQFEGYTDTVTATGHGSGDVAKAKQILTEAGYKIKGGNLYTPEGKKVPPFTIRYTTGNAIRQTTVELFTSMVKKLGVDVQIKTTDDLGSTLTQQDYDIILFGWIGSPFPFGSGIQNWTTGSASNFGNFSNKKVDKLLRQAAASTDRQAALKKLAEADKLISEAAYVLPLYQKPSFFAVYNRYGNIRPNPTLAGPPYNVHEWGLEASQG